MAITGALCLSYKSEVLQGVHVSTDTYMIALFRSATATLDKTTTVYGVTGEIAFTGYTAGGVALAGFAIISTGDERGVSFTTPQWTPVSFSAEGALIYNATRANKAVCVLDFAGTITSTNDVFKVTPAAAGFWALT